MLKIKGFLSSPKLHLVVLIIIPVAMILLPVEWINGSGMPVCIWWHITGHPCWGCGLTRAMVSVMHLDFTEAWEFNRLAVLVFPIMSWFWGRLMYRTIKSLRHE